MWQIVKIIAAIKYQGQGIEQGQDQQKQKAWCACFEPYPRLLNVFSGDGEKAGFRFANSLWLSAGPEADPAFAGKIRAGFQGETRTLDFTAATAADSIDKWVSVRTGNQAMTTARFMALQPDTGRVCNLLIGQRPWPHNRNRMPRRRWPDPM